MKKPKGYDEAMIYTDNRRLPAGGYVVEIKDVTTGAWSNGRTYLDFTFDISEGKFEGYYKKQFEDSTLPDKKYKGHIRIQIPLDDDSDEDKRANSRLKTAVTAIEHSNEGYEFDWNEKSLIGKTVGLLFRNKEYSWQGREGFWTEPFLFISADRVRSGDFEIPRDKLLEPKQPETRPAFEAIRDDDIPF